MYQSRAGFVSKLKDILDRREQLPSYAWKEKVVWDFYAVTELTMLPVLASSGVWWGLVCVLAVQGVPAEGGQVGQEEGQGRAGRCVKEGRQRRAELAVLSVLT